MDKKYQTTIKVKDGWGLQMFNPMTGEIEEVTQQIKEKHYKEGYSNPMKKASFTRHFSKSWAFLKGKVTDRELRIIVELRDLATWKTNSLRPLGDDTTKKTLSEQFGIASKYADQTFNKLFDLGILARTQVTASSGKVITYWLFNPWLGFNGPVMDDSTWEIFKETSFAELYSPPKEYKEEMG